MDVEEGRWLLFASEVLKSSKSAPKQMHQEIWCVQLVDGRWVTEHEMRKHSMFFINHHCDGDNCTLIPAYGSVYLYIHEPVPANSFLRLDYFAANKMIGAKEQPWFTCTCGGETCRFAPRKRVATTLGVAEANIQGGVVFL